MDGAKAYNLLTEPSGALVEDETIKVIFWCWARAEKWGPHCAFSPSAPLSRKLLPDYRGFHFSGLGYRFLKKQVDIIQADLLDPRNGWLTAGENVIYMAGLSSKQ